MKNIAFFDTEVSMKTKKIVDFGAIKSSGEWIHEDNLSRLIDFLLSVDFICGHNIIHHDLKYLDTSVTKANKFFIDTLYLSPLLFPQQPYHRLVKDDKLQTEELNNPLNDAKKARVLFYDEVEAYHKLPLEIKRIFYTLLNNQNEFQGFFKFLDFSETVTDICGAIKTFFSGKICHNVNIKEIIENSPVELAYSLALIHVDDDYSITPRWILKQYPLVDNIIFRLRGNPCVTGCAYCNDKLDIYTGLKSIFQFDNFRDFDGVPLQEQAVKAAVLNKSLLAIFPTGGGKSLTFQLPALMAGRNIKGLTVVISPLQSLMKDQVENLEKKNITEAVTINGLLDPIERAKSIERIEKGEAYLLYLSPESLRSNTIERLLLGRKISRFVIDEAHCFSAWGQDFRVDYMYIAEFIKQLQTKKNLTEKIPVSCFTATAKQNVINDIMKYFKDQLDLDLELFQTSSGRKNLRYKVIRTEESKKYHVMRELLDNYQCPTIIYVSRTKKAEKLSERLNNDGYNSREYHGKMEKNNRIDNQEAFINGNVDIMVATSAFGMGVDKKDVGMVIHYDISDSLENYVQEAGRAGRDQELSANCFVLFNEEDLSKHFMLLNQTKLSLQEIQQVWKAIKAATKTRLRMSNSALEIAREAGWNDSVQDIESRVKTAIAALEDSGYIKRRNNMPRVYADSILAKNVSEATAKIKLPNFLMPIQKLKHEE